MYKQQDRKKPQPRAAVPHVHGKPHVHGRSSIAAVVPHVYGKSYTCACAVDFELPNCFGFFRHS